MHFGFALDLSDIDLLNVDLLDQRYTHLDLFVSKTSWRRLQRNNFSSSKTSCERSWKRLQDVFKTSWKTKNCYAEDVLKKSSIHVSNKCLLGGLVKSTCDITQGSVLESLLFLLYIDELNQAIKLCERWHKLIIIR